MFRYHKDAHSAFSTQDYVFQQLIPYIGNKRRLLSIILQAINHKGLAFHEFTVFVDRV